MLDALITGGLGLIGSILGNREEARRRERQMEMIREIMREQRQNLAEAKAGLIKGRAAYMNNPGRAETMARYEKMLREEGPFNGSTVSAMKSTAGAAIGRNSALQMSQLRESLAKRGISGSGMAMAATNQAARNASADTVGQQTDIDIKTRKTNEDYKRSALDAYQNMMMGDAKQQYGFEEDYASLLGSVNYGNSLSAFAG